MRKIIVLSILFSLSILPFYGDTYASCNGWFQFSSSCNDVPPYCEGDSCSLEKGLDPVEKIIGDDLTNKPISDFAQDIVAYLLTFISIIAVIYVMYAGVQILIGGGDEEKIKKAKNIILYVFLGVALMWLSYGIVQWTFTLLDNTKDKTSIIDILIPNTHANTFTESENDTFKDYQNRVRIALQTIEGELKVNKAASTSSLSNLKTLVQGAFDRLPDIGESGTENDTAKRAVDIDIDVALKNPTDRNLVGNALSRVNTFIDTAKILAITGDVSVTPSEGNAPLTVSFRANNIKDPSGTTPDIQNYVWWMRGNGGRRIEIGRGPSLTYTFQQEGTFTVFLDVISGSRNTKGKIDVLPLSIEKQVEVKPKLGDIILLVNGVNVSNLQSLKVSPSIGNLGILFDATASRAAGNGVITETTWDFGNGNTLTYKGSPIVERQLYTNQGTYPVKLTIKTNSNQTFTKDFQLLVRDPSAIIQIDKTVGHIGEVMSFRSLSYFTSQNNIEYSWSIQDENNKKVLKSGVGQSLSYTFENIGTYIVTLTTRSPNGNTDSDSKTITIESRDPVINLNTPTPLSKEYPNVIVFDASKSYDPDSMSRKGLTFTWRLDGEKVTLDKLEQDGSKGQLTFDKKGTHAISVTVSNIYGKIQTLEKTFEVTSILSVNFIALPEVAPIGTIRNFIGRSENAAFFEWNLGDGSAPVNGTRKIHQHSFQKTGLYRVTLTVKDRDGIESNQVTKTVYATDTNSPFANIVITNGSNSAYEDMNACKEGAIVLNRSEASNFDGSKSLNIDGSSDKLSYTWEYFSKVKTTPYISEKFSDLGCFPIKLTVKGSNGASHTSVKYIALKNQLPELTGLTTTIDSTKKDAQKLLVKVTANGARDPDGVITSYIWYYTTESDKEPQNVQITQKNEITFVLPNITEKYYFGVILEDNDGGRINSSDNGSEQAPLIVDNQNGNIHLPLITLSAPKIGIVDDTLSFSVDAKTILGTNITNKAEYSWDFDGDGKFDIQKSSNPKVTYSYKNSGTYTIKVKVTHNGVSNTKYQTLSIKNPLKANFYGFRLPNGDIYLLNSSKGTYDRTVWNINGEPVESLYSYIIKKENIPANNILGTMTVSAGDNDSHTTNIDIKDVRDMTGSGGTYQSSPLAIDNTIRVSGPGEKVYISLIGNVGNRFVIDEDTSIDSDLDAIPDNDEDNKDTPSYTDGSVFSIQDFDTNGNKRKNIKVSVYNGNSLVYSENITLEFDYIVESESVSGEAINLGGGGFSEFEKTELEKLSALIREMESSERVILMQLYNLMIEEWGDGFTKAKTLIDLQDQVSSMNIADTKKDAFYQTIDALLVGDAQTIDNVTLAVKVIEGLIPESSTNRTLLLEKLEYIRSHPQLLSENKEIAKEILQLVESDSEIENKYKLHIKNQLLIILGGGQIVSSEEPTPVIASGGTSIMYWILMVLVVLTILGIVGLLVAFVYYRSTRKDTDQGFADFLIDAIFHKHENSPLQTENIQIKEVTKVQNDRPIQSTPIGTQEKSSIGEVSTLSDPLSQVPDTTPQIGTTHGETSAYTYDPLKDFSTSLGENETTDTSNLNPPPVMDESPVPDWLKGVNLSSDSLETSTSPQSNILPNTTDREENETLVIESTEPIESGLSDTSLSIPTETLPEITHESPNQNESQKIEISDLPPDENLNVEDILLVKEEKPEDVLLVKEDTENISPFESTENISVTMNTPTGEISISPPSEDIKTITPPQFERDPGMPDWLSLDPVDKSTPSEGESLVSKTTNEEASHEGNHLPDWLVASVNPSGEPGEALTEKSSEPEEPTESLLDIIGSTEEPNQDITNEEPKEKKSPPNRKKSQKDTSNKKTSSAPSHDNIPDWLK